VATHIVRIYRAGKGSPPWLVGVVEEVGGKEQLSFKDAEELWAILAKREGVGGVRGGEGATGRRAAGRP